MDIVAELGGSHGGDFKRAIALIDTARACGATHVKFQTFKPEQLAADVVVQGGPWAGQRYRDLYMQTYLPWDWHAELFAYAKSLGLVPFSSAFSEEAVDFLETIGCAMYKIASPEITHLNLIRYAATTGKPVILSTGCATWEVVEDAIEQCEEAVTVLHCVSSYPAKASDYKLQWLKELIYTNVGVSDHTQDVTLATVAAALDCNMIERHLTLTTHLPDDCFASRPEQFKAMTEAVRQVEAMNGMVLPPSQQAKEYMRCIWTTTPIKAGELVTRANVAVLRPYREGSFSPTAMAHLTSGDIRATRDIEANTALSWTDLNV